MAGLFWFYRCSTLPLERDFALVLNAACLNPFQRTTHPISGIRATRSVEMEFGLNGLADERSRVLTYICSAANDIKRMASQWTFWRSLI